MKKSNTILVVDAHAHPPKKEVNSFYAAPRTQEEAESLLLLSIEEMVAQMDRLKTNVKMMFAIPSDIEYLYHYGEHNVDTGITTSTSLEWIIRAQELYPNRFYGVACLDPTRPESIETLEFLVKEHCFKAAKMIPGHYKFDVNDKKIYNFYKKCIELDIPVAFHTGYSPFREVDRLIPAMPIMLDELAYDLPELKIDLCHVGGHWYQDAVLVALRNENIILDFSMLTYICKFLVYPKIDPGELIKRIVEIIGPDRLMFGADNDDPEMNLDFMESLDLGEHDLRKIMGENAARFFKLDQR
ncbi:amidohydrolase family protein [Youxingia wuxianensis]|jgi:predicted TIM-barrel fold metal-dependent hydrolase|uniref:Amidohydrolase n=1 Tax=Youxingia wuxianensis TaxID=2763678 RepID=A0A926IIM0_9FIRM|nr:amidohydrolase family protein [Youxingia wuxianensis]MBC8585823.1 amidohydrolase [Youxingia wuxianensis]